MIANRRVLNLRHVGIPDVPVFGYYEYSSVHPGLRTHRHSGAVEICYLYRGRQIYRVAGREYNLSGGDVFVTAPGEPHDTAEHPEEPGVLYWLNLRVPKHRASLLMLPPGDSARLARRLCGLPERKFKGSTTVKRIFDEIFEVYDGPIHPLKRVTVSNLLVRLVLEVLNCAEKHDGLHRSAAIGRIAEMIRSHPEGIFPVSDLAAEAGLSISRFKAKFKTELGVGPHEYILRTKIEAAKKQLLDKTTTITGVAMEFGFSSSQYFATVFRRYTSQTPREFRIHGPAVPLRRGTTLMPRMS
jgi:AraC-like DNA-binding protein